MSTVLAPERRAQEICDETGDGSCAFPQLSGQPGYSPHKLPTLMGGFAKNQYVGHDGPLPDHSTDGCATACIESIDTACPWCDEFDASEASPVKRAGYQCMLCAPFCVQSITSRRKRSPSPRFEAYVCICTNLRNKNGEQFSDHL